MLLGLSREDDVDGSEIPALYFSFLRSQAFSLIDPVVEHNAMDLVGLAAVVLLGALYLDDYSLAGDGGEIFGLGRLCERAGLLEKAEAFYLAARESSARSDVRTLATRRLSILLKKKKLFSEALQLWQVLSAGDDVAAMREISIHYRASRAQFRRGGHLRGKSPGQFPLEPRPAAGTGKAARAPAKEARQAGRERSAQRQVTGPRSPPSFPAWRYFPIFIDFPFLPVYNRGRGKADCRPWMGGWHPGRETGCSCDMGLATYLDSPGTNPSCTEEKA